MPLNKNNLKITKVSQTGGNTNNVNSINQSQNKNNDCENSNSNINLALINLVHQPTKLNLNNLKNNIKKKNFKLKNKIFFYLLHSLIIFAAFSDSFL